MSLVLEIEYLSGVSFAAVGPDSEVPDWPPQPDRMYSALVATWAARGEDAEEAKALEWLEALPTPRLLAPHAEPRTSAVVFVPPNDPRSDRVKTAIGVLPMLRSRQPRRFPAVRLPDSVARVCWLHATPTPATFMALRDLARDTSYVGHSASLTRCRFTVEPEPLGISEAKAPARGIYPGRLAELCRSFSAQQRPLLGARVASAKVLAAQPEGHFGTRWLILEHVGGEMPDVRAAALVAKALRDTLLSGYQRIGLGASIPEIVSGHAADGNPSRDPHLAIVPLAFAGFAHADARVMGYALVPPRGSAILDDDALRHALRTLAPLDQRRGRRVMTIKPKQGTSPGRSFEIALSPAFDPPADKRSLDPRLYTRPACVFASVTPIVLDRHLKQTGEARASEIAALVAVACRNVGLPEPVAVMIDKHSAVEGAPSAYPSSGAPERARWRVPPSLGSRGLTHAVVRFAQPIVGPVLVGAGRFVGLGLCLPLERSAGDAHAR